MRSSNAGNNDNKRQFKEGRLSNDSLRGTTEKATRKGRNKVSSLDDESIGPGAGFSAGIKKDCDRFQKQYEGNFESKSNTTRGATKSKLRAYKAAGSSRNKLFGAIKSNTNEQLETRKSVENIASEFSRISGQVDKFGKQSERLHRALAKGFTGVKSTIRGLAKIVKGLITKPKERIENVEVNIIKTDIEKKKSIFQSKIKKNKITSELKR